MTKITSPDGGVPLDVFEAARRFEALWNSSARAVARTTIEWQCDTWGSGRGRGDWEDVGLFRLVAEVFRLETDRNYDRRDELVVTVAFSLPKPISVFDGSHLCHYSGAVATGVSSTARGAGVWTTYGPFSAKDGIRLLWTYHNDGDPTPQGQTVTVMLSGKFGHEVTVQQYIDAHRAQLEDEGRGWGEELQTLVPLSVQLLLYLAASEPDLETLEPGTISSRPTTSDRGIVCRSLSGFRPSSQEHKRVLIWKARSLWPTPEPRLLYDLDRLALSRVAQSSQSETVTQST